MDNNGVHGSVKTINQLGKLLLNVKGPFEINSGNFAIRLAFWYSSGALCYFRSNTVAHWLSESQTISDYVRLSKCRKAYLFLEFWPGHVHDIVIVSDNYHHLRMKINCLAQIELIKEFEAKSVDLFLSQHSSKFIQLPNYVHSCVRPGLWSKFMGWHF
jgi:hypothetical protein